MDTCRAVVTAAASHSRGQGRDAGGRVVTLRRLGVGGRFRRGKEMWPRSGAYRARACALALAPSRGARACGRGGDVFYTQGQSPEPRTREYFYFVDHQGQLFLDDTKVKNFTTCFKGTAGSRHCHLPSPLGQPPTLPSKAPPPPLARTWALGVWSVAAPFAPQTCSSWSPSFPA
ncbi:UPF0598 protein C8orf82 homolog [Tamandua tetradactyla]|uniref:UPF0598 protein C8orf82 homolog n=1 Tax=Tamandua tetradactyla TaxID=48850 RepID=UPI004054008D